MTHQSQSAPGVPLEAADRRDEQLAELLAQLADGRRQGAAADIEEVARRHPELAGELRQLWTAVVVTDELASISDPEVPAVAAPDRAASPENAAPTAETPRRFGVYAHLVAVGRGGLGVVYRARQASLGRTVALKMLLRAELASAADEARFQAEAQSAARLDHPQIVPVYEVGRHDGRPYFSMKFIEGTTLARRLAESPLPAREAAALLADVARAVHYAHSQGVLHRDLKPSNILIDGEGRPHVTVFGLAKQLEGDSGLTRSGAVLGTPSYMAPEQAAGSRGQLGPGSDVYSLGAILYQMLTGRAPFQAASPVDTVLQVLEQDPLPPRLLNANVDRDLELVALRCLQKPPDLRYPSAAALADDLEAYLAGEPVSARSGGFSQVIARWFRETHHATVLENWGLLWMWHSLVLLVLCVLTSFLQRRGASSPAPYLAIWVVGLGTWAGVFWALRRRAGPVTFVERQIAHVWAASIIASTLLFGVEMLLGLPVLALSPVLGLISGMVFLVKAGILSGAFYVQAAALFLTAAVMALMPDVGIPIFGVVSAACFFIPGLKYYRQRARTTRTASRS